MDTAGRIHACATEAEAALGRVKSRIDRPTALPGTARCCSDRRLLCGTTAPSALKPA